MTAFSTDPRDDSLAVSYRGEGGKLFWLALWTGMLTILTVGIYRFWAKTRVRRYMWSSTTPGGNPFEYTGTGLEKLLGFLLAIVILVVYLGLVQLILAAVGLSIISDQSELTVVLVTYISIFAVMPLWYIAAYRGRRYILSRTRWRGVRFGAEKGAFGYMLRALGYGLLSIITLGILAPLATFKLQKFMVDRSWFGDAQFVQGGKWTMLYKPMLHIFISIVLFAVGFGLIATGEEGLAILGGVMFFLAYFWFLFGIVYYGVHSHRLLWANRVLGDGIRFQSLPRTGTVIGTYIVGYLAVSILTTIAIIPIGLVIVGVLGGLDAMGDIDAMMSGGAGIGVAILIILAYIFILVLAGALAMVFITQPILKHYLDESTIYNASELDTIHQRAGQSNVDAEGFADALDVGAAF